MTLFCCVVAVDSQDYDRVLEQRLKDAAYFQDINPQCGGCTRQQGQMRSIDPLTSDLLGVTKLQGVVAHTDQSL